MAEFTVVGCASYTYQHKKYVNGKTFTVTDPDEIERLASTGLFDVDYDEAETTGAKPARKVRRGRVTAKAIVESKAKEQRAAARRARPAVADDDAGLLDTGVVRI